MPFDAEFDDVYRLGIKDACVSAGAYFERVDEQIFDERILDRIYNQIAKADFIVADMTGRNPNVFYEVGYAHALGKRTILLTKEAADIPFDLKHFPHIVYGNSIVKLRETLQTRIKYFVDQPTSAGLPQKDIEIFVEDRDIGGAEIVHLYDADEMPNVTLTVHNASSRTIEPGEVKIGILTHHWESLVQDAQVVKLPTGEFLHMLPDCQRLFPDAFDSLWFAVELEDGEVGGPGHETSVIVRLFTPSGPRDFPLVLQSRAR